MGTDNLESAIILSSHRGVQRMAKEVEDLVIRRNRAIISQWVQNPNMIVSAVDVTELPLLVSLYNHNSKPKIMALGNIDLNNAFMLKSEGNPDYNASIWVRCGKKGCHYTEYRAAYRKFLEQAYNIKIEKKDPEGREVDHLLNLGRAETEGVFVRVEAVKTRVNRAWGGGFERVSSSDHFSVSNSRSKRIISWSIAAKLGDQMPPRNKYDKDGLERLKIFFKGMGISELELTNKVANIEKHFSHHYQFTKGGQE